MAIEVFSRYESKYLLDAPTYEALSGQLEKYMRPDAYSQKLGFYPISNLYFDSDDDFLIRTSLQKPRYKEKLRLRAYGVPDMDSTVYLEIKKKVRGLVSKRRCGLTLAQALDFIETGAVPETEHYRTGQVLREIEYLMRLRSLRPRVYISYSRRALIDNDPKSDLRVSFDIDLFTRRDDLKLENGPYGEGLLPEGKVLMEVKTAHALPLWLTSMLTEYRIFPASFSKYGAEHIRSVRERLEGADDGRVVRLPLAGKSGSARPAQYPAAAVSAFSRSR